MNRLSSLRRQAFTLVELLVVIAIIGVLAALTAAAVMQFRNKGPEVQTRADISELSNAIGAFKSHFKVDILRSRLVVKNIYRSSDPVEHWNSFKYLKRLFPRLAEGTNPGNNPDGPFTVNWAPQFGSIPANGLTLDGNQCLVLLLGGVDNLGFSTNPTQPFASVPAAGSPKIGPFFEFKQQRLKPDMPSFKRYNDPYGTPYIYFSKFSDAGNDYNTPIPQSVPASSEIRIAPNTPPITAVSPYLITGSTTKFANANSFQIISAGADKVFGPGGQHWTPTQNAYREGLTDTNRQPASGFDDMSNFSDKLLGVPLN